MKIILCFLFLFFVSGCASSGNKPASNPVARYISQYEQSMKNGELKKSIYYTGLYNAFSETSFVDKGISMKLLVSLISISKKLEENEISREQFDIERMKYVADFEIDRANLFASIPQPQQQPYVYIPTDYSKGTSSNNRIRCTSSPIGDTVYTNCN